MTGNVKRFVEKLEMKNVKIYEGLIVDESYVLVTYTFRFGEVPIATREFLEVNHQYLKGVASSGNRIWGERFAQAADIISNKYSVSILHKFELAGTKNDVEIFKMEVQKIVESNS